MSGEHHQREGSTRVLVVGATGNTGSQVAARLTELGFLVRAVSRGGKPVGAAREHARFDWADESSHGDALRGVERMYLVAPALDDDPSTLMLPFIERALESGVRRIVLLSGSPVQEGSPGLGLVHRALRRQAPAWAVLRPSWFMQNFVDSRHHHHGASLRRDGTMVTATGEGRVGFVDALDIAEVAVRALADVTSHDTEHVITGPEALRYDDIADILSRVTGRPMRVIHVSTDAAQRWMMDSGIPERYARFLAQLEESIRGGSEGRVTPTVLRVTGRAPRSFEEFAKARLAAFEAL